MFVNFRIRKGPLNFPADDSMLSEASHGKKNNLCTRENASLFPFLLGTLPCPAALRSGTLSRHHDAGGGGGRRDLLFL